MEAVYGSWNEFQAGTIGQFASRAEAGEAWSAYKAANGMVADVAGEAASIHGNSLLSLRTAYLYRLETKSGEFLKWGVTQDTGVRYTKAFMLDKEMVPWAVGTRADMIRIERGLVETQPGRLNLEPWRGARL